MPAIAITPASAVGGTTFTVSGSGFVRGARLKMTVDGGGATSNRFRAERNGTFVVGVTTGTSSALGTHSVKILNDSTSALLAQGTFEVVAAAPVEPPPVEPPPVEPPPTTGKSLTVTSISALLSALADNTLDEIVVKNGTYQVAGAGNVASNSLWINERFAARTKPILVRAETKGGVTFDGGGSTTNAMAFVAGAHDQTWDGFNFANITPTLAAVIMFGGFDSQAAKPPARNITMRNITGVTGIVGNGQTAHMVYVGHPTPTNIVLDDFTVKGSGTSGISALHSYHDPNARTLTARRWTVSNVYRGMLLWSDMTGFLAEDWTITGAGMSVDIRTVKGTLRRITASNSGAPSIPSTIVQENCSWAATAPVPPPTTNSVTVSSITALLAALDDNTLDEIVVKNGTYQVSGASRKLADSLWIGAKYADRTRSILVRAETPGGVTFDGRGSTYFLGLWFGEGAHDQTWDGFNFGNGEPTQTGVIVFGGTYGNLALPWLAPHHITLRNIKILGTIRSSYAGSGDHSIYISESQGGAHDILIENYTVDGAGGVNTALTMYHSQTGFQNAWNVTVRNMTVTGTYQAIEIWDATIKNLLIEKVQISNVRSKAVRYEIGGPVTLKDIVSTGTPGGNGFYSSKGANPAGVTFVNCNFG